MAANADMVEAKRKLKIYFEKTDSRMGDVYIPSMGGNTERADKAFKLFNEIERRFDETKLRSLLLLGNSGMGKTCLGLHYCKVAWQSIVLDETIESNPIPLYIYLPKYKRALVLEKDVPKKDLLKMLLKSIGLSENEQAAIKKQPLLLILDGFDEVDVDYNLYTAHKWGSHDLNIRMLVTCRPEAVSKKNKQMLFEAAASLKERSYFEIIYLQSFTDEQIKLYLNKYLEYKKKSEDVKDDKKKEENEIEGSEEKQEKFEPCVPEDASEDTQKKRIIQNTKGEGDCAFHAILGEERDGVVQYDNVPSARKMLSETIINPNRLECSEIREKFEEKIREGIRDWIIFEVQFTLEYLDPKLGHWKLARNYLEVKKETDPLKMWGCFIGEVKKYSDIVDYIEKNHSLKNPDASFHDKFSNILSDQAADKGQELRTLILSIPRLQQSFEEFSQKTKEDYNWEAAILRYPEAREEFAKFIGGPGSWLAAVELTLIAYIFNKTVYYFPYPNAEMMVLNPGESALVMIQFNGVNHFERVIFDTQIYKDRQDKEETNNDREEENIILSTTEHYLTWFEKLPELKVLIKIPFLLMVITRILPDILGRLPNGDDISQRKFTQNELFYSFLASWFCTQTKKVKENIPGLPFCEEDLYLYMWAYAQNLASSRWKDNGQLDESPIIEENSLNLGFIEPVRNQELLKKYQKEHYKLFSENNDYIKWVRWGCLLHTIDGEFKFLHKSITEYLASKELMDGVLAEGKHYLNALLNQDDKDVSRGLNGVLITDSGTLSRLAEAAQDNKSFEELLWNIVFKSKDTYGLSNAAANAITVLNHAGVDFSGQDFSNVQIPGADLSSGNFVGVNFRGANLQGVNFSQAYLQQSDFSGANLERVQFGEKAYYELQSVPTCIAFYKHTRELHYLIGCRDGYVYRYDDDGNCITKLRHKSWFDSDIKVNTLAIHQLSHLLVTGGSDGALWSWDLISNNYKHEFKDDERGHQKEVSCCAITPDGSMLISGGKDSALCCWSIANGQLIWSIGNGPFISVLPSWHKDEITCCAISPDGSKLVSGSCDAWCMWSITDDQFIQPLERQEERVGCCAISPDGLTLVSGRPGVTISRSGYATTLHQWSMVDGKFIQALGEYKDQVNCCAITPDGLGVVVTGFCSSTLYLFSMIDGKLIRTLKGHRVWVSCCAITSDGATLASGCWDKTLRRWSMTDASFVRAVEVHEQGVNCCAISPNGVTLVSGGCDKTLRLWSMIDGKFIRALKGHENMLTCCAITPDGSMLVSGSNDKSLRLWSMVDGKFIGALEGHKNAISCCAITPDGSTLVSGSNDKSLRLWSMVDGKFIGALEGHKDAISCCAITPDSSMLISGSHDFTLRLWLIASGQFIRALKGHKAQILCCAIALDGSMLVSGSYDSTLRLWRLDNGSCVKTIEMDTVVTTLLCWKNLLISGNTVGQIFSWSIESPLSPDFKLKWRWVRHAATTLNLVEANITQSFISPQNEALCQQRGSLGEPNRNKKIEYQSWCTLFRPIPGTAHDATQQSLIALNNGKRFIISNENWVLSIVRDKKPPKENQSFFERISNSSKSDNHAFLILEGVKNNRYFIVRADLYTTENSKYAQIKLKPLEDLMLFKVSVKNYEANSFKISEEKGNKLLQNIKNDQGKVIRYNIRGNVNPSSEKDDPNVSETHNCLSWCRKQANLIECNVEEKWYNCIFTLPGDVTQPLDKVDEQGGSSIQFRTLKK